MGERPKDSFYHAVGHALSQWAAVEDALGDLLQCMCIDQDTLFVNRYLHVVFGAIENTPGRLQAFEAAAAIYLEPYWGIPIVQKPIKAIRREINDASFRRNDIAHGKVVQVADEAVQLVLDPKSKRGYRQKKPVHRGADLGYMLVAPDFATNRHRSRPFSYPEDDPLARFRSAYRFTAKDILFFGWKFEVLAMELRKFHHLLSRPLPERDPVLITRLKAEQPKAFERGGPQ